MARQIDLAALSGSPLWEERPAVKVLLLTCLMLADENLTLRISTRRLSDEAYLTRKQVRNAIKTCQRLGYMAHKRAQEGAHEAAQITILNVESIIESGAHKRAQEGAHKRAHSRASLKVVDVKDVAVDVDVSPVVKKKTPLLTPSPPKQFVKPCAAEVAAYALSIAYTLDGNKFCDFYESKGWMIGKNHMKDWRAAVRTWKRSGYDGNGHGVPAPGSITYVGAKVIPKRVPEKELSEEERQGALAAIGALKNTLRAREIPKPTESELAAEKSRMNHG